MYSRWFNVAVVLLWMTTMGWLVTTKVLPSLLVGDPPSYQTILAAQKAEPQVGWSILWNERRIGWALNSTRPLGQGLMEVRSRVHFEELPLKEMLPEWLHSFLKPLDQVPGGLKMDARNRLSFDPLGRLSRFDSAVGFDPEEDLIKIHGQIDGAKMTVTIRCGNMSTWDLTDLTLPGNTMLGDSLSPQTNLPGLRQGQTWTIQSYSPLRPPTDPMEILHAEVEGTVPVFWGAETIRAWVVNYHTDPGAGTAKAGVSRGKLWVAPDGTVIKQQVVFLNSTMTFARLGPAETQTLARSAGSDDDFMDKPLTPFGARRQGPR